MHAVGNRLGGDGDFISAIAAKVYRPSSDSPG